MAARYDSCWKPMKDLDMICIHGGDAKGSANVVGIVSIFNDSEEYRQGHVQALL